MERIKKLLQEDGIEFLETKIFKNGIEKKALAVGSGSCKIVIYDDTFNDSETDEEIMESIRSYLEDKPELETVNTWTSWEYACKNIRFELRPRSTADDEKFVKKIINDKLELIYRIFIKNATIPVPHQLLKNWKVDEAELYLFALENIEDNTSVIPMDEDDLRITNNERNYGAASIFNTINLEYIAEKYNDDLYIVPSSVHGCMLSLASKNNYESLKEIIAERNRTQIFPEDFLADYPFFYKKGSMKIDFEPKTT